MTSIRSSRIIANGSENQRSAPKVSAASRALGSLRVATAASFRPGRPLIAGTCDTFAQLALVSAPTIPTRISFGVMANNLEKTLSGLKTSGVGYAAALLRRHHHPFDP